MIINYFVFCNANQLPIFHSYTNCNSYRRSEGPYENFLRQKNNENFPLKTGKKFFKVTFAVRNQEM